jgi:methyl-accepting chemotaxis protein
MSPVKKYIFVFIIVIFISLVLALIVSVLYSSHISRPVVELIKQMKEVENGHLEIELKNGNSNIYEINSLRKTFYKMVLNLNNIITNINTSTKEINSMTSVMYQAACSSIEKSEHAQKSILNISENIRKQADNTIYASNGIESLANQIAASRELSQNVYNFLGLLNNSTENGKEQIENLENKSLHNLNNTNIMKKVVSELQQEMKQINTITETIQNIAKQTHLLSLNATIEAFRAGESGKGFAIVAKEIKD